MKESIRKQMTLKLERSEACLLCTLYWMYATHDLLLLEIKLTITPDYESVVCLIERSFLFNKSWEIQFCNMIFDGFIQIRSYIN